MKKILLIGVLFIILSIVTFANSDFTPDGYQIDCSDNRYTFCDNFSRASFSPLWTEGASSNWALTSGYATATGNAQTTNSIWQQNTPLNNSFDYTTEHTCTVNSVGDSFYPMIDADGTFSGGITIGRIIAGGIDIHGRTYPPAITVNNNLTIRYFHQAGTTTWHAQIWENNNLRNTISNTTGGSDATFGVLMFPWTGAVVKCYYVSSWIGNFSDAPYLTNGTASALTFNMPNNINQTNNSQIIFDINCSEPGDVTNLYFNFSNGFAKITNNTAQLLWETNVTVEKPYNYFATCNDTTNSTQRTWTYDISKPTITINPTNFFNTSNESIILITSANKLLNITYTDNRDLFAYEINITNSTNGTVYFNSSESLSGTLFNFLTTVNFEGWGLGRFNFFTRVTDSHTANKIKDYDIDIQNNKLIFETTEGNTIKIMSEINTIPQFNKERDRYNFGFIFDENSDTRKEFRLYCDNELIYKPESIYLGHFICWNPLTRKGNWIDFEGVVTEIEIEYKEPTLQDPYYKIVIDSDNDDILFNSIGGLNENTLSVGFNLTDTRIPITYTDFVTYNGINYTRVLNYTFAVNCRSDQLAIVDRYINENLNKSEIIPCINESLEITETYEHQNENLFNISLFFNYSFDPTIEPWFGNATFLADLNNPQVDLNLLTTSTFINGTLNMTLKCIDSLDINLTYNLTHNGSNFFFENLSNGTLHWNSTELVDGAVTTIGECSDLFGTTRDTQIINQYFRSIDLIDEIDNTLFNLVNITGARLYRDDNSSFYDYKDNNKNSVNITIINDPRLRIELLYEDGTIINRYINLELIDEDPVRICANKEGTTHFEQLLISSAPRTAVLKSVFAQCYVAADNTIFAFETTYLLRAFTIDRPYTVFTNDNGDIFLLVGIDGGVQSVINIDSLVAQQTPYDFSILKDSLNFERLSNTSILIRYNNIDLPNDELNVTIRRLDTNQIVFFDDSFTNKDNFTLTYDWSTLSGINDTTLFEITLESKNAGGSNTIKEYFNRLAQNGFIPAAVAVVISIFMLIFGMTFTITKLSFSWFGIAILVIGLAVLSFAVPSWYTIFMMAIYVVTLIYVIIVMTMKNSDTISG